MTTRPRLPLCRCGHCDQLVLVGRAIMFDDGCGGRAHVGNRPRVHKAEGVRCPGSDGEACRPPGAPMMWLPGDLVEDTRPENPSRKKERP